MKRCGKFFPLYAEFLLYIQRYSRNWNKNDDDDDVEVKKGCLFVSSTMQIDDEFFLFTFYILFRGNGFMQLDGIIFSARNVNF